MEWRNTDKEPLSAAELAKLIGTREVADFLNPRSTPYKALGLGTRSVGKAEAIRLIRQDVNLLKRPLVVAGRRIIFGLDEQAYRELGS